MSFENLVLGFNVDPELLGGNPVFRSIVFRDVNPLSGKTKSRRLDMPNQAMSIIHRRLKYYLRNLNPDYPYATAFRPGDSTLKNVKRHAHNRFFYLLDFRHAYQGVNIKKLAQALCEASPELRALVSEAQVFLEKYCTSIYGGLPTGAPSSQDLFNLYCNFVLDRQLAMLCAQQGLTYTRYSDDLAFSSKHFISISVRRKIRDTIEEAGFTINHSKSELRDLAKGSICMNGVGLQLGGRIFTPRPFLRHTRGLLHKGIRGRTDLEPKIAGAMSVVLSSTDRRNPNCTEMKVLQMRQKFRTRLGQIKKDERARTL